jgi:hypothetical protein
VKLNHVERRLIVIENIPKVRDSKNHDFMKKYIAKLVNAQDPSYKMGTMFVSIDPTKPPISEVFLI